MKSILVVDDSKVIRQAITDSLKKVGFSVSVTCNGKDALNTARKNDHDLVITDMNMPVMDGLTLVSHLRKLPSYKDTPILVLTAENLAELKVKGRAAGASGWIVKPFMPNHHVPVICKFLVHYRDKLALSLP